MSIREVCLVLATLVVCSQGVDVKYSELIAGGHVINMGMKLSYTDKSTPVTEYNEGKPCPLGSPDDDPPPCQNPKFTNDDDSVLVLTLTPPKKLDTLKKAGDEGKFTLSDPKTLTVKLCFAKPWTVNRKWRKAKDKISKDKRCSKNIVKKFDLASATSDIKLEYKLPTDIPRAQWFFTAYLECEVNEKKGDTAFCGLDTTGGLGVLSNTKDVESAIGADGDAKKALAAPTSPDLHIFSTVRESRPAGLFVAVIIMSVLSVSMLFGFFIYEQVTKKSK